jgi:hypothetical protein
MAGTLENINVTRTREDSFPKTDSIELSSVTSLYLSCDGESGVQYVLKNSGGTGFLKPGMGERKPLFTNVDPIDETLEITFFDPSSVNIFYSKGSGSSTANIDNLLSKKQGQGYLLQGADPIPNYPFQLLKFSIEFTTEDLFSIDFTNVLLTCNRIEDVLNALNQNQPYISFYKYSNTQILARDNNNNASTLKLVTLNTSVGDIDFPTFIYDGGDTYTSSLDFINDNVKRLTNYLAALVVPNRFEINVFDSPTTLVYLGFKSLEFIVMSGNITVEWVKPNEPAVSVGYPIIGNNLTKYGDVLSFPYSDQVRVNIDVPAGAKIYVKVTYRGLQ